MKKAAWIMAVMAVARVLAAEEIDLAALAGEDWYGLYMTGEKAGYAVNRLSIADSGHVTFEEEAHFRIRAGDIPQDMSISSRRVYHPDGQLVLVEQKVEDIGGTSLFQGRAEDGQFILRTDVGGDQAEAIIDEPEETLLDALKSVRLLKGEPRIGDELSFTRFEPMFKQEITGLARIINIEDRMLDGAETRIFEVKTEENLATAQLGSVVILAEDGKMLEGTMSGILTMRLEPEEMAKDVDYTNDVIVSNAALVDAPLPNARNLESLRLELSGPLEPGHLFNDERQYLAARDDVFEFRATRIDLDGFESATRPIEREDVQQWLKPSTFVQSDHPRIIAQAEEIVGDEPCALTAATRLNEWVYRNVHTTYSARLSNALEVLDNPEGDCTEHSVLFVGLARAAGIPAREVAGLIYVHSPKPGFYFHQWATVWVGKWVDMDPTFNQPSVDVTHIKLAEGDLFEQSQLIPIIGQIRVRVLEKDDD